MSLPLCGGAGHDLFADAEREIRRRATEAEMPASRWEARECHHCPLVHVLDLSKPLPAWTTAPRGSVIPRGVRGRVATHPCGTDAAYRRHKRRGEPACTLCLEANAARRRAAAARQRAARKAAA